MIRLTCLAYVFDKSKVTQGLTVIHPLTNPPTIQPAYHLLHSVHPDHYGIFLAIPSDSPGDIVLGEVQVLGGLGANHGEKVFLALFVAHIRLSFYTNRKRSLLSGIKLVG